MTINLQRLPLLTAMRVIHHLDIYTLIKMLHTSSRIRRLVKAAKVPVNLEVLKNTIKCKKLNSPDEELEIVLRVQSDLVQNELFFQHPVGHRVNVNWTDETEVYNKTVDLLRSIFVINSVQIMSDHVRSDLLFDVIEHLTRLQLPINQAVIITCGNDADGDQRVMQICAPIPKVVISLNTAGGFNFQHFNTYRSEEFRLSIYNDAAWFAVNHLSALANCRLVSIRNVELQSEQLNEFLKSWIASTGRIRELDIQMGRSVLAAEVVIRSLDAIIMVPDSKYKITRADGKAGIVFISFKQLELYVSDE